jgi:hypothetical protein
LTFAVESKLFVADIFKYILKFYQLDEIEAIENISHISLFSYGNLLLLSYITGIGQVKLYILQGIIYIRIVEE